MLCWNRLHVIQNDTVNKILNSWVILGLYLQQHCNAESQIVRHVFDSRTPSITALTGCLDTHTLAVVSDLWPLQWWMGIFLFFYRSHKLFIIHRLYWQNPQTEYTDPFWHKWSHTDKYTHKAIHLWMRKCTPTSDTGAEFTYSDPGLFLCRRKKKAEEKARRREKDYPFFVALTLWSWS